MRLVLGANTGFIDEHQTTAGQIQKHNQNHAKKRFSANRLKRWAKRETKNEHRIASDTKGLDLLLVLNQARDFALNA